jgi:hypothetical protein
MASINDAHAWIRAEFRELLGCVPPGMTPDQALEKRMALMRAAEAHAGRGESTAVWLGALLFTLLVWALVFTPGA